MLFERIYLKIYVIELLIKDKAEKTHRETIQTNRKQDWIRCSFNGKT